MPADVRKGFAFPSGFILKTEAPPPLLRQAFEAQPLTDLSEQLPERQSLSAHRAAEPRLLDLFFKNHKLVAI